MWIRKKIKLIFIVILNAIFIIAIAGSIHSFMVRINMVRTYKDDAFNRYFNLKYTGTQVIENEFKDIYGRWHLIIKFEPDKLEEVCRALENQYKKDKSMILNDKNPNNAIVLGYDGNIEDEIGFVCSFHMKKNDMRIKQTYPGAFIVRTVDGMCRAYICF